MLFQTVAPTTEPVTLAEARVQCRLTASDSTADDGSIEDVWIPAARRHAEAYTGRSFITQSWRLTMDAFPGCIELERGDVQQIDSLTYRDMAGTVQTIAWAVVANGVQRSSDGTLVAEFSGGIGRIAPAFGNTWPVALSEIGAITVTYTAGYGDATAVPAGIRAWILLRVARMYENREEPVDGEAASSYLDGLLDPYIA